MVNVISRNFIGPAISISPMPRRHRSPVLVSETQRRITYRVKALRYITIFEIYDSIFTCSTGRLMDPCSVGPLNVLTLTIVVQSWCRVFLQFSKQWSDIGVSDRHCFI
jgi:hypothetical protein